MTFLTPLLAGIAAAVAIPSLVILYFLKLRRQEVEISTTLLWKKAIQDLQANAPFQRLRRNILLLLQLIVLGAALFALAQPQLKSEVVGGVRQVILIDRSASMQATDEDDGAGGRRSRLDAAKERAKEIVEGLREPSFFDPGSGDEAMVIAFDTTAEVLQQFTGDKRRLREVIEGIDASDGPSSMGEAVRLAKAHAPVRRHIDNDGSIRIIEGMTQGDPITMHLISDGRLPDSRQAAPGPEDNFVFHRVGTAGAENLAVVGLRAERAFDNPARLSVYVAVQSTFASAVTTDVELAIDGVVRGIRSLTLAAAEPGQPVAAVEGEAPAAGRLKPSSDGVVFTLDLAEGALAEVRLVRGPSEARESDALSMDDRAALVIRPARKLSVGVVTRGNLFVSSALGGLPLARLETFTPERYAEVVRTGKSGEYDVWVVDGVLPIPGPGEKLGEQTGLPPGRFIVLNAVPGPSLVDRGKGPLSGVVDWQRDHPTLRYVSLDSLVLAESRLVDVVPGAGVRTLVLTDQGPAVMELTSAETRALVVPFDVSQSTWPFDVSFVVFMATGVSYLGDTAGSGGESSRSLQTGGTLSDRLPVGSGGATIRTPEGAELTLAVSSDGGVAYAPVRRAGVYRVRWEGASDGAGGDRERRYAANLLDGAESDVGVDDRIELASRSVAALASGPRAGDRRLWPWLLLGALGVLLVEWYIYNRKVYV